MPFGKFKGIPMEDVKADYLLWLWDEGIHELPIDLPLPTGRHQVARYIRENFRALETEARDYIVQHPPSR